MGNQLELYRAEAVRIVEQFRCRYREGGDGDRYIGIARRWSDALHRDELDPNELSEVIREAEQYRSQADIAFFGFINDMRGVYNRLWGRYLTRDGGEGTGR